MDASSTGCLVSATSHLSISQGGAATRGALAVQTSQKGRVFHHPFWEAISRIETTGTLAREPGEGGGAATDELPFRLKPIAHEENRIYFEKSILAKKICEEQGLSHLIIPGAVAHENFYLVERLPVVMRGTKAQICLYMETIDQFTEAAQQLTRFLCQVECVRLMGTRADDPYSCRDVLGRYEIASLCLAEDSEGKSEQSGLLKGCIAILDPQELGFRETTQRVTTGRFSACMKAVNFFPHHLDQIIEAAKAFDPKIEERRSELQKESDRVLRIFDNVYRGHQAFLQQNDITFTNPLQLKGASDEVKEIIKTVLKAHVMGANRIYFEGCLGKSVEANLKSYLENAFPMILDAVYAMMTDFIELNIDRNGGRDAINSYAKLLAVRTLEIKEENTKVMLTFRTCQKAIVDAMTMLKFSDPFDACSFAREVVDLLLPLLAKHGVIASYNPIFGYEAYAHRCICC